MMDIVTAILLVVGGLFSFLGALGVLRMPDVYCMTQPATKAATMGVGLVMLAVVLAIPTVESTAKGLLIIGFVFLTAPIGTHMLLRSAYRAGVPLAAQTVVDERAQDFDGNAPVIRE